QLRFGWSPRFRKLEVVPAADTRNEFPSGYGRCALCDRFLELVNRKGPFDPSCLITRVDAAPGVVDVRIDKTWNNSAAPEVDRSHSGGRRSSLSDTHDAAVFDRQPRPDNTSPIHKFPVN